MSNLKRYRFCGYGSIYIETKNKAAVTVRVLIDILNRLVRKHVFARMNWVGTSHLASAKPRAVPHETTVPNVPCAHGGSGLSFSGPLLSKLQRCCTNPNRKFFGRKVCYVQSLPCYFNHSSLPYSFNPSIFVREICCSKFTFLFQPLYRVDGGHARHFSTKLIIRSIFLTGFAAFFLHARGLRALGPGGQGGGRAQCSEVHPVHVRGAGFWRQIGLLNVG